MRSKDLKEGHLAHMADRVEQDHEVQMARAELYKLAKYSIKLHDMLKNVSEQQGLEGWVQSKITKAADYIGSVFHHLEYDAKFGDDMIETTDVSEDAYKQSLAKRLEEKAVSKSQQQAAGAALSAKRGDTPKSELTGASKEMMKMSTKELEKFAGTKHKGLPDKVEEGDNIYHPCVKSFKHEKFGEGTVIPGEHTLLEDGTVTHYDARFVNAHGQKFIVRNIPVANMYETVVVEHSHPAKKKKKK